jgi:transcriptional regulator of acetoin/glycerol metabolism
MSLLDPSLADLRRRFHEKGALPNVGLPPAILRSWARCAGLGLDMTRKPDLLPMSALELKDYHERNERLRRLARPALDALSGEARASGSIVILADPGGAVLDAVGSYDFASKAARLALQPGVIWSEATSGTNAIGTAIAERTAVQVLGSEHFFETHGILGCSAAPIFGPQGEVAGAIDISSHVSVRHAHTLAAVAFAVDQIEHRFFETLEPGRTKLRFHSDPDLIGTSREGILVFEEDRLVAANRHGLALLKIGPTDIGKALAREIFPLSTLEGFSGNRMVLGSGEAVNVRLDTVRRSVTRGFDPLSQVSGLGFFDAGARTALERAVRLLEADIPLHLEGETGTGKEVFARAVHRLSSRRDRPFVAVKCAALAESIMEAELFGTVASSATGARRMGERGLMRKADGGVLFLDDVDELPLALQARLLGVLQAREVTPVGGAVPVPVDFALLTATHRNLEHLVEEGKFRADLYFRIAQYPVHRPSLRELPDRAAVIKALWAMVQPRADGPELSAECLDVLARSDWPGNFRQAVGTLRALVALAGPEGEVMLDMLPADVRHASQPVPPPAAEPGPVIGDQTLDTLTDATMRRVLDACNGNVSAAARRLGVNRSTIYRRILGLKPGAGGEGVN